MPTTDLMIEQLIRHRADPAGVPLDQFWLLVERFRADLVNQGFAVLGNLQDAEDVAQESLCRAYRDLNRLQDPLKLGIWIRQINRCNALDLRRRRVREKSAKEQTQDPGAATGGFDRVDMREVVARAVDSLPEDLRTVVVFRYWEHLPYQDIADKLGIPLGTVKSQLSRADHLLEQRLSSIITSAAPADAVKARAQEGHTKGAEA